MANRFPLVVDTSDSNKIKEIPSGDNLQLSGNDIIGVVNITGSGTLTVESIVATNITKGGTPLATVATSGSYADLSNTPTNISTFTNDSNYVTSGSNISVLTNDAGYLTTVAFGDLTSTPTTLSGYGITDAATSAQGTLADSAIQPGANVSTLNNDAGYITVAQIQAGDLTVDVNNSGDLIGSVFGQDSTILVDAILSSINTTGTIRGHTTPHVDAVYDLGATDKQFRNAYVSGTINGNTTGYHTGDVTGSIFADDSTLLVDAVAGKIVGPYDNGIVSINPTNVTTYDLFVQQDANTLDSYVNGTLYGGATSNAKNLAIGSTPPTDSTGADGDRAGMIAFDSTSIYYCIANWASPGTANIWVKQDWGTTGAWS